ncbi:MAG: aldo/keto reductase [bacterium]|nr:aldo/keto reductase [bacterium]
MLNRRDFLTTSAAAALSAAIAQKADAAPATSEGEWRNKQSGMAYRRLGRTNFMVSEIVMGGVRVRGDRWEHILPAIDRGLNYLDTSTAYGRGASEEGIAQVLKVRPREQLFIASKVGSWSDNRNLLYQQIFDSLDETEQKRLRHLAAEDIERRQAEDPDYFGGYFKGQIGPLRSCALSDVMARQYGHKIDRGANYRQFVIDSVEQSLKRIGTDYLDIIACPHGASSPYEIANHPEIFDAFEKLKRQGKVRHLSLSAHNDPGGVLSAAVDAKVYSLAMVAYNIINHRFVDSALKKAKAADLGVIAMKVARPVHNGRGDGAPDDPARVKLIEDAVPGPLKVPQKAYVWALRNPNLTGVISDIINQNMVDDNLPLAGEKSAG